MLFYAAIFKVDINLISWFSLVKELNLLRAYFSSSYMIAFFFFFAAMHSTGDGLVFMKIKSL